MEKRVRRTFTDAFKTETVELVRSSGKTIAQISRDLDLTETAVRRWVEQTAIDAGQRYGLTTTEREELARLRREVRAELARVTMHGMAVRGVVGCVPSRTVSNDTDYPWFEPTEIRKVTAMAGIKTRHVVDDDTSLAHLGHAMLTPLGYEVVACTSGYEALHVFLQTPQSFDLVITDETMPHMTGEMLVRALRRIRPNIPVILCTGYSSGIDAEKARAQGIEAFLMKPLSLDTLAPTIQRLLAQRQASPS